MKIKPLPCPFCGTVPTGKKFCSTVSGPALMCENCGAEGPHALKTEVVGANEFRFIPKAIKVWNKRAMDSESYRRGIAVAAAFVQEFDKYVQHRYRLSDCILGKFNLIKKKEIQKNENLSVKALVTAIRYYQVCFQKIGHPSSRLQPTIRFVRAMDALHKSTSERRTMLSKEHRERQKSDGFLRRKP